MQQQIDSLQEQVKALQEQVNQLVACNKRIQCTYGGIFQHLHNNSQTHVYDEVDITSSDGENTTLTNILLIDDNNSSYCLILHKDENKLYPWICFDFKDRQIHLTNYTIRSNFSEANHGAHPKSWVFEGSHDKKEWSVLDERKDCPNLNGKSAIHTFTLAKHTRQDYRYVRMRITDKNWFGNYTLSFAYIELYGALINQ